MFPTSKLGDYFATKHVKLNFSDQFVLVFSYIFNFSEAGEQVGVCKAEKLYGERGSSDHQYALAQPLLPPGMELTKTKHAHETH